MTSNPERAVEELETIGAPLEPFNIFQVVCGQWADETFPQATLTSRLNHLRSELDEIGKAPTDIMEWADAFMLLSHAARGEGHIMTDILDAAWAKLGINRKREWGAPNDQGFVEHVTKPPSNA